MSFPKWMFSGQHTSVFWFEGYKVRGNIPSGQFYFHLWSSENALISANVISDTSRSTVIGANVPLGNIRVLEWTWSYVPFDGPDYHAGNGLNMGAMSSQKRCRFRGQRIDNERSVKPGLAAFNISMGAMASCVRRRGND